MSKTLNASSPCTEIPPSDGIPSASKQAEAEWSTLCPSPGCALKCQAPKPALILTSVGCACAKRSSSTSSGSSFVIVYSYARPLERRRVEATLFPYAMIPGIIPEMSMDLCRHACVRACVRALEHGFFLLSSACNNL